MGSSTVDVNTVDVNTVGVSTVGIGVGVSHVCKLILILQDKREVNEEISLEEELKKAILIERNKQLNQFSSIYFKKVEINTTINEK